MTKTFNQINDTVTVHTIIFMRTSITNAKKKCTKNLNFVKNNFIIRSN